MDQYVDEGELANEGLKFPNLDKRKRSKQTITEEDRADIQFERESRDVRSPKKKKRKHKKKSKINSDNKEINDENRRSKHHKTRNREFSGTEYLQGNQESLKTTATKMNQLGTTNNSYNKSMFKSLDALKQKAPEGTLDDLKSANNQLKSEVADTIVMIDIKVNKFKQTKNQLLADQRKTVREKEIEDDNNLEHYNSMLTKKNKYSALK